MIPGAVLDAAATHGWTLPGLQHRRLNGDVMATLNRNREIIIDIHYDRWRHTKARAYRGRALMAVLSGQRAVVEFMGSLATT